MTVDAEGDVLIGVSECSETTGRVRLWERVQAGLGRAQWKTLDRSRGAIRHERVKALRERGISIREIASETSVGVMTIQRLLVARQSTDRMCQAP